MIRAKLLSHARDPIEGSLRGGRRIYPSLIFFPLPIFHDSLRPDFSQLPRRHGQLLRKTSMGLTPDARRAGM
jgi:hypothetical protein